MTLTKTQITALKTLQEGGEIVKMDMHPYRFQILTERGAKTLNRTSLNNLMCEGYLYLEYTGRFGHKSVLLTELGKKIAL